MARDKVEGEHLYNALGRTESGVICPFSLSENSETRPYTDHKGYE